MICNLYTIAVCNITYYIIVYNVYLNVYKSISRNSFKNIVIDQDETDDSL